MAWSNIFFFAVGSFVGIIIGLWMSEKMKKVRIPTVDEISETVKKQGRLYDPAKHNKNKNES